jgi:hypothetical protein
MATLFANAADADSAPAAAAQTKLDGHLPEMKNIHCNLCVATNCILQSQSANLHEPGPGLGELATKLEASSSISNLKAGYSISDSDDIESPSTSKHKTSISVYV